MVRWLFCLREGDDDDWDGDGRARDARKLGLWIGVEWVLLFGLVLGAGHSAGCLTCFCSFNDKAVTYTSDD